MERLEQQLESLAEKFKGQAVVSVKDTTLRKVAEEWRWTLAIKLATGESFNVQGLAAVLKRVWRMSQGVMFVGIPGAMAMVKFDSEDKMNKVLEGGPWTFAGAAVLFEKWEVGCQPQSLAFEKLRIWVQIHNLPFELVREDMAIEVAGVAGVVCREMKLDGEVTNRRFVRFQVEIDIRDQVKAGCYLARPGKPPVWVHFKYERLPELCQRCGALNHDCSRCEANVKEGVGPWLKAETTEVWSPERSQGEQIREENEDQLDISEGPSAMEKGVVGPEARKDKSEEGARKDYRCGAENVREGAMKCRKEKSVQEKGAEADKGKGIASDVATSRDNQNEGRGDVRNLGLDMVDGALFGGPTMRATLTPVRERKVKKKVQDKSKLIGVRQAIFKHKGGWGRRKAVGMRGETDEDPDNSGGEGCMEDADEQTISDWVSAEIARRSRREQ